MKNLVLLIVFILNTAFAQAQNSGIGSGILAFKAVSEQNTPNYSVAYRQLSAELKADPKNAELHYFFGYTLDRMNTLDGKTMYQTRKDLAIRSSQQFEAVNKIEPQYTGEYVILDPYSKISSIWGSLAAAYLQQGDRDSAIWAFKEGKKRGGFLESVLSFNRQLLNSCAKDAILVTVGDNLTFPIWYLQTVEKSRTDITAVDASLINAPWYPIYLKRQLKLSYADAAINTMGSLEWKPQKVSVVNPQNKAESFSWLLKPTYSDQTIYIGERILLDIIQQNFYSRPIYFFSDLDTTYNLFLDSHLRKEGLVNRLMSSETNIPLTDQEIASIYGNFSLKGIDSREFFNSRDALHILNKLRILFINQVTELIDLGEIEKAKRLFAEMNTKFPVEQLPYSEPEMKAYFQKIASKLNKDGR